MRLKKGNSNDWIIYSDSDEIPNLENFDLRKCENKIVLFNQRLFIISLIYVYKIIIGLDLKLVE